MAYLTYIIDNYHALPEILVFLHSHRNGWPEGWHTDNSNYDNVESVKALQLGQYYVGSHAVVTCQR